MLLLSLTTNYNGFWMKNHNNYVVKLRSRILENNRYARNGYPRKSDLIEELYNAALIFLTEIKTHSTIEIFNFVNLWHRYPKLFFFRSTCNTSYAGLIYSTTHTNLYKRKISFHCYTFPLVRISVIWTVTFMSLLFCPFGKISGLLGALKGLGKENGKQNLYEKFETHDG